MYNKPTRPTYILYTKQLDPQHRSCLGYEVTPPFPACKAHQTKAASLVTKLISTSTSSSVMSGSGRGRGGRGSNNNSKQPIGTRYSGHVIGY